MFAIEYGLLLGTGGCKVFFSLFGLEKFWFGEPLWGFNFRKEAVDAGKQQTIKKHKKVCHNETNNSTMASMIRMILAAIGVVLYQ